MASSHWSFPPPANTSLLPSTSLNLDLNTAILTYLNTSASHAPSSGFGRTATYRPDSMNIAWPDVGDYVSPKRSWHCMSCRQTLNSTEESQNWDACRYGTNTSLPRLHTLIFPIDPEPARQKTNTTWLLNHVPRLPESTVDQSLICAFGIPDTEPYELTASFRFINRPRFETTGHNYYRFNSSAPEGEEIYIGSLPTDEEMRERERKFRWSVDAIAGFCILVVVVGGVVISGTMCWVKRRKAKKLGIGANIELQDARVVVEEGSGEGLPSDEQPRTYNETVWQGGHK